MPFKGDTTEVSGSHIPYLDKIVRFNAVIAH